MVSKKIVLHFPKDMLDKPVISRLARQFDLEFNILKASITPSEEGLMVLELSGKKENYQKGVRYLKESGVHIQNLSQDVLRNEEKCTHCGVCVPLCPLNAFQVDNKTREVKFMEDKCIGCELCIKVCPPRAMEVHF